MHGLIFSGPADVRFADDLPDPTLRGSGEAIVAVDAAGLCGSDLHPYEGREAARGDVVPGHEAVGRVLQVGTGVRGFVPGDRVLVPFTTCCGRCAACARGLSARCAHGQLFGWGDPDDPTAEPLHGGQAERLRVPLADGTLVALPPGRSLLDGVLLADNLPTGWTAVERLGEVAGQTVVVLGLGAVGLCAVWAARRLGAAAVIAVDPVPARRGRAERLGAVAVSPDGAATLAAEVAPDGVTGVVEAAGTAAAQRAAASLVRPGGTISLIAVQTAAHLGFSAVTLYDRNLTVVSGRASVRSLLERLLPGLDGVTLPTDVVVSHPELPLSDGPGAYATFAARGDGLVKAVFRP
ncbi:alcohol dehydrogenase catalytic domain-containing protein [Egicoccus halophilus]|uniref:Alcohol dehydrogenase n=1 Tax=Egicoccus halophilus TaxID=1670830 RepID=A0A8J3EYS4_9ACTN|nr:alcohol dehydrogenase catalytic domain-containing protein [Egicoccus halophilus]GGI08476.1 alcohol dehydrogenase [Egicoccus halophilus]